MTEHEGGLVTPREFDYWKLTYRELALSPDWAKLDAEARARQLLEKIEIRLNEADAPPQIKALFDCSIDGRLQTVRQMIERFENKR